MPVSVAKWALLTAAGCMVDHQLLGSATAGWPTYAWSLAILVGLSSVVVAWQEGRMRRRFAAAWAAHASKAQPPPAPASAAAAAAEMVPCRGTSGMKPACSQAQAEAQVQAARAVAQLVLGQGTGSIHGTCHVAKAAKTAVAAAIAAAAAEGRPLSKCYRRSSGSKLATVSIKVRAAVHVCAHACVQGSIGRQAVL